MINQKETATLIQKQKEVREGMVFRHGGSRSILQGEFTQVRDKQQGERTLLAKRIHEFRQMQEREQKRSIRPTFDHAGHDKSESRNKHSDRPRSPSSKRATRTRERKLE